MTGLTWNMMLLSAAMFLAVVLDSLYAVLMELEGGRDD